MILILFGLSAYGCGDSATVTEPAVLGSLSASDGILEPPFNSATTNYTVKLFGNEASTTITVSPQVSGDTVQINNQQRTSQTVTLASIGMSEVLNIVVTDTGTGGTSKAYSVRVSREEEDTTLAALSSSQGTVAPSPFDKSKLDQSINDIDTNVTSITLTATKSALNTEMVIGVPPTSVTVPTGTSSGNTTVQLGGTGSSTTVPIVITGPKGGKTTYQVTINRGASKNSFLKNLTTSPVGIQGFKAGTTTYEVNVGSGVETVKVTATPADPTATISFLVNNTAINPQSIPLRAPGETTPITVRVTAQDGTTRTDYKINVIRAALDGNNKLKSLSIAPGRLDFKVNQPKYDVNVLSSVETVKVTATPEDSTAKITITPQPIALLAPGNTTTITVRVTADNGKFQDYTINVKRAALNGNADLKSLAVSPGSLSFNPDDQDYTVGLLSNVTSVQITAAPEDSAATVAINNGQPQPISLGTPGPEVRITVPVVVTAQNQKDKETYSITFVRAALGGNNNLKDLGVTSHTLSPAFSQTRTNPNYALEVENTVGSVTVTAIPQDPGASVKFLVSNVAQPTSSISLPSGPSTTEIEIEVTAQNGSPKSYFIAVTRKAPSSNNNLKALSVTAGSVNQPINLGTPPYIASVTADTINVTVTATLEDTNATMEINNTATSSGVASASITLGLPGSDTNIPIVVRAVNGDPKDYALTVRKAAAAPTKPEKPNAAPDLITRDDSCPLKPLSVGNETFTNDDCAFPGDIDRFDNVTIITTPRFRIPQPGTEETPNLYVDGTKVDSIFEQTAISSSETVPTLKPTAALPGSNNGIQHTITSTVTNTTTNLESDKSAPLTVTISTGQSF